MTAEQINKLPKAIAFTWCVGHGNGAQKWLAQYHKLIKYNKLNKDMNVVCLCTFRFSFCTGDVYVDFSTACV